VQQELDQSLEEPKASVSVESEKGKHRFINLFGLRSSYPLHFSIYVLLYAFKFQELFET
jgi:hypothetical protein